MSEGVWGCLCLKGGLTSFGVMCKIIAHLIQSCLLFVLAKFQGLKTNRTRATINFLRPFKTGNYFCRIVVCDAVCAVVCDVVMRSRRFEKTFCHTKNAGIQDYGPARSVLAVFFFV